MILDDVIWLESIVEKLAWKHHIVPVEVEEVLQGQCRILKKPPGTLTGRICTTRLDKPRAAGIFP